MAISASTSDCRTSRANRNQRRPPGADAACLLSALVPQSDLERSGVRTAATVLTCTTTETAWHRSHHTSGEGLGECGGTVEVGELIEECEDASCEVVVLAVLSASGKMPNANAKRQSRENGGLVEGRMNMGLVDDD